MPGRPHMDDEAATVLGGDQSLRDRQQVNKRR
jgi:hypothetical protein